MQPIEHEFLSEPLSTNDAPSTHGTHGILIRTYSKKDRDLVARTIRILERRSVACRAVMQEDRIMRLVDALIADEPRSAVELELEADNAALRAAYLETVPTYTAAEIHDLAGSKAVNKSALAGGWKEKRRIFAVPFRGADRFPAFQFVDGQPRLVVRDVLAKLPETMTPWQTALWFASGNGWLDGAAPQDCLDEGVAVIDAARQMATETVG